MEELIEKESVPVVKEYHFLGSRTERIVFLVLLTFISASPIIFRDSLPAHADWHSHAANAHHFQRCFWQGQWLPRWIDTTLYGYGMPKFNYYAPLFYYIYTFVDLIFRDPFCSMKWLLVLTMALPAVFGYLYLRKHGSAVSSCIVMSFVIFSPAIHMYTYNNNFPTNTLAIPFIFLILYGIDTFDKTKNFDMKSFLITSLGYALLILSHLATAFMFTLLIVPYFLLSLQLYRTKKFVKQFALSMVLGASLAAFYLYPATQETNLVHTEVIARGAGWDYTKNFMYTFLDRLPSDGYYWGIFDHRYYEVSNALFGLAVLICLVVLLINIDKVKTYVKEPSRINIAIAMFTISFLMMTPISIFIWLMIKQMKSLQFPWRFASLILPFGAVVMVYAFDLIGKFLKEKINLSSIRFLCCSIAILFALLLYVDFINIFRWYWVSRENYVRHAMYVVWQNREYQPNLTGDPNWEQNDYGRDFLPTILSSNPISDVTLIKWSSHKRIFQIFSETDHQIRFRTFYFPGWNVYIDGKQSTISMDPKSGAMVVQVGAGKHEIVLTFELTPLRKGASYCSFIALAIYLYFFLSFLKEKRINRLSTSGNNIQANEMQAV